MYVTAAALRAGAAAELVSIRKKEKYAYFPRDVYILATHIATETFGSFSVPALSLLLDWDCIIS